MVNPLLLELLQANKLADVPDLRRFLTWFGLPDSGPRIWGLADVEIDGPHYQPVPRGTPALIAASYEGRMEAGLSIVDLVAISMRGQHAMRTRRGVATFLGGDNVELAADNEWPLFLYENGWSWIRNRCRGAVIVDWRLAPHRLTHMRAIACETPALAGRLRRFFERPLPLPDLTIVPPKETLHAA
jgi:hypothetical protein